jgi:PKD repeat protein
MQISSLSPAPAARRLLAAAALVVALVALSADHASAAEGPQYGSIGQYGEVTRFGGFDSTAYDNEAYDKPQTPGKFLNPVGFAVDPDDAEAGGTAVYVLDRVSDWPARTQLTQGTQWRLQKLSETGAVLGSTEFYLPKTIVAEARFHVPVSVVGLAVDSTTGQIYTVLEGPTGTGEAATQYADEVIGWSTTPNSEKKLVAPGSKTDSVSTPVAGYSSPGLISSSSQLSGTPVYTPEGLAVDDFGGQDYVAIEGESSQRTGEGVVQGPAIVEQVSTGGPSLGDETASWSAASLTKSIANASSADATGSAAGISSNANGSLTALLGTESSQLDAVALPADLSSAPPTVIASKAIDSTSEWAGALQTAGAESPFRQRTSAPAVQLSNGLYASDYWINAGGKGYWNESTTEGIRLLQPSSAEGLLSNPLLPPTSIFDTLGNDTQGANCYLGNEGVSGAPNYVALAAGAQGAVWILTAGEDSSSGAEAENETGRQVIELAPGTPGEAKRCVGPTGIFTVTDTTSAKPTGVDASTSSPLKITVGSTVEFDASKIEYPASSGEQAAIYAYEWAPIGSEYTTISDTATEHQPPATTSYQYKVPGVYDAKLKLLGDFGEYDEDGTIVVQTASPPVAALKAPATAQTGQAVSFDAGQSQPASGASIAAYQWKFGDGATDETQSASDTHVYTTPGTYTVTLSVLDNDTQESSPVSQQIIVTSPPPSGGGKTVGGGGNTTTTPSVTPPVASIDRSPTNVSPNAADTNNTIEVTLTCPTTKTSCGGTAAIKTADAVASSVGKGKGKGKKKILVLGQKTFSLNGGQRETLTIRLSPTGLALLKKDRSLKIDVVVTAHDSYGDPLTRTIALTLREPVTKKAAHKK